MKYTQLYGYNLSLEAICLVLIDMTVCQLVVCCIYMSISFTCAFMFSDYKCPLWMWYSSWHLHLCLALTEVRECLLSFGAEPFVFQVAIQKLKDQDI
jgi:hypothetical protein